jgi:hypothetical protein
MNLDDLTELRKRIDRLLTRLSVKDGPGFSQSHTLANGETHHYQINGVKSLAEFEDDLLSTFVWVWSMKDYFKTAASNCGRERRHIEDIVNSRLPLQLVADIANRAKHGSLTESRSGHFAVLGSVSMSIPQQAMACISFEAFNVTTDVADPSLVTFEVDVLSQTGIRLGSAGNVLKDSMDAWEEEAAPYVIEAHPGDQD